MKTPRHHVYKNISLLLQLELLKLLFSGLFISYNHEHLESVLTLSKLISTIHA